MTAALIAILALVTALPISAGAADLAQVKQSYRRPAEIPASIENPTSPAKIELGRTLFFEPRLSESGTLSCATCHSPLTGWSDRVAKPLNDRKVLMARRTQPTVNLAWAVKLLWDGRAPPLDRMALAPMTSPAIMALPAEQAVARMAAIPGYQPLFEAAFPGEPITPDTIAMAIATFERTLVSAPAPFDAWVEGDETALSATARRGFELFTGSAGCSACHSGWAFTDQGFYDIGLADITDLGRGKIMPAVERLQHAFKTPTLRDVALRPPYMHDGSLPSLAAVIDHYAEGALDRPSRAEAVRKPVLTAADRLALIAFLESLTGRREAFQIPPPP